MSEKQRKLESSYVNNGTLKFQKDCRQRMDIGFGSTLPQIKMMTSRWYEELVKLIQYQKNKIKRGKHGRSLNLVGGILSEIPASRMSAITILSTMDYLMQKPGWSDDRLKVCLEISKSLNTLDQSFEVWNYEARHAIGSMCLDRLQIVAQFETLEGEVPAFVNHTIQFKNKKKTIIGISPIVKEVYQQMTNIMKERVPVLGHMVDKPKEWNSEEDGGYLTIGMPLITHTDHRSKRFKDKDLSSAFNTVNCLSNQSFKIDQDMSSIMEKIWDTGGNAAGLPRRNIIPKPTKPNKESLQDQWLKEYREVKQENKCQMYDRFRFIKQIKEMESIGSDPFYLPRFLDYRGRCYAHSQVIGHQTRDRIRGLLKFGDEYAEPVGENGLWHLQIQLAQHFGHKGTLRELNAWSEKHRYDIKDAAANPVNCEWWQNADKPWQSLSIILELSKVYEHGIGYQSTIPIMNDGTSNSTQHYASMNRCQDEAVICNLIPNEYPEDLYSQVCSLAMALINQDKIVHHSVKEHAKNIVYRKNIKTPIIATSYSCSMITVEEDYIRPLFPRDMDYKQKFHASWFVTKKIMQAYHDLCPITIKAMNWIKHNARKIAKHNRVVSWETPSGFPVFLPYETRSRKRVSIGKGTVYVKDSKSKNRVDVGKTCRSAPASFIQSYDASHMWETAKEMRSMGLAFADNHDCFWTTPSQVDTMNEVIRNKWCDIHRRPALEVLKNQWALEHPDIVFDPIPKLGLLDIDTVKDSIYFFH